MWFLMAFLIVVWLIAFITFGASAYWVHILLVGALALFVLDVVHGRRKTV